MCLMIRLITSRSTSVVGDHTNACARRDEEPTTTNVVSLIIVTVELRATIKWLLATLTLVTMMVRSFDGAALSKYHTFVDSDDCITSGQEVWFHRIETLLHLRPSTHPHHRSTHLRTANSNATSTAIDQLCC